MVVEKYLATPSVRNCGLGTKKQTKRPTDNERPTNSLRTHKSIEILAKKIKPGHSKFKWQEIDKSKFFEIEKQNF